MLRATFVFLTLACLCLPARCQSSEPQSRTLEAVLSEIRQLRQDLQTAVYAARKAQIVIYRLHLQAAVVERATERLDNSRNELSQMESQIQYQTAQIKRYEELKDAAESEQQKKQLDDYISGTRANLEIWIPQEQELRIKQSELEADLRTEQAKWRQLEDELDRLDNALENAALQASTRH